MDGTISVTRSEMRTLFRQVARILAAMSLDKLEIVDDPADLTRSIDALFSARGNDYKPTIRELRLKERILEVPDGVSQDGARTTRSNIHNTKQVRRVDNGDRVVYVLRNKRADLTDFAPSGQKVVQLLVKDGPSSIKTIMKATNLQRSTVANQLAILRDNDIVESVPVSQINQR